jgi:hypothetical protein
MKRSVAVLMSVLALSTACALGQEGGAPKGEAKSPFEEVVKQMLETLDSVSATLATIHDEATAKAAEANLRKAAGKWHLVKEKSEKLPPPAKEEKERVAKEYKTKLEQAQKKLLGEVARVSAVPGGRAALLEIRDVLDKKSKQ